MAVLEQEAVEPGGAGDREGAGVILVADDDRATLDMLREIFEADGYEVHVAENGDAVLRCTEAYRPDLAVLDLVMPGGGAELIGELRERRPGLPIVVVTAYGYADLPEEMHGLGVRRFFHKPVSSGELSRAIGALLAA